MPLPPKWHSSPKYLRSHSHRNDPRVDAGAVQPTHALLRALVDVISAGGSREARYAVAASRLVILVEVAGAVVAVAILLTHVNLPRLARDARELCSAAALEVTCLLADVTRSSDAHSLSNSQT